MWLPVRSIDFWLKMWHLCRGCFRLLCILATCRYCWYFWVITWCFVSSIHLWLWCVCCGRHCLTACCYCYYCIWSVCRNRHMNSVHFSHSLCMLANSVIKGVFHSAILSCFNILNLSLFLSGIPFGWCCSFSLFNFCWWFFNNMNNFFLGGALSFAFPRIFDVLPAVQEPVHLWLGMCVISLRILQHLNRGAALPYHDFGAREEKSPLGTCMSSSTGL